MINFQKIVKISNILFKKHQIGRCFHVSFILEKSKIRLFATNNYLKSHPQIENFGYHLYSKIHSELAVCLKLGMTDCSNLTIVNVRINNLGKVDNSCFCKGCRNLIDYLSFKKAYYSTKNGEFKEYLIK